MNGRKLQLMVAKKRAPKRFERPPIVMVLPGRFYFILKDGYGYAPQDDRKLESVRRVYQKATMPASYTLVLEVIDNWAEKMPENVADSVVEYWIPVTTRDISLKLNNSYNTKEVIGNPLYQFVVCEDLSQVNHLVDVLLQIRYYPPPIPVPVIMRGLPQVKPEPGIKFTNPQYESIREVASEIGVNRSTLSRRLRSGKSLEKYANAINSNIPSAVAYKAINRNINLGEVLKGGRLEKKTSKKLDKLADSYGVSRRTLLKVMRGKINAGRKYQ